jgi:hypothetical protein
VQADGTLGNSQAQSGAAGLPLPCCIQAVKGAEKIADLLVGDPRAVVSYGDDRQWSAAILGAATKANLNFACGRGLAHRIAHHIFESAAQQLRITHSGAVFGLY